MVKFELLHIHHIITQLLFIYCFYLSFYLELNWVVQQDLPVIQQNNLHVHYHPR